jgi:hypothetical protein
VGKPDDGTVKKNAASRPLTFDELGAIDEFRFRTRKVSRVAAVRALLKKTLERLRTVARPQDED